MSQLSLFSADLTAPRLEDLGGLLAAHGTIVELGDAALLQIALDERWRADALTRECLVRDVDAEVLAEPRPTDDPVAPEVERTGGVTLRTGRSRALRALALDWTQGPIKAVPFELVVGPGLLRCWTLAAGRRSEVGYILGLDPRAPETHESLAAACARAGLAGSLIGLRAGGPGIRIVGHRRCVRLAEMVGTPPPGVPREAFPPFEH